MIDPIFYMQAHNLHNYYHEQEPGPSAIFENFMDPEVMRSLIGESLTMSDDHFDKYEDIGDGKVYDDHAYMNLKRGCRHLDKMPPVMKTVCRYFNSNKFMEWLQVVTGIKNLQPDPNYLGGGYHQTLPGGHLSLHKDFTYHKGLKLYRKVNLLIYLNKSWDESLGGNLELWDNDMTKKYHTVVPVANTAVLFNIEDAIHGCPDPVKQDRRSLAFYYYNDEKTSDDTTRAMWKKEGSKELI